MPTKQDSQGLITPNAPTFWQRVGARLICWVAGAMTCTLRYRWVDESGFFSKPPAEPVIFCLWHNRLALSMKIQTAYVRRRSSASGLAAMVSASKDGAFLAAILECFCVQPVRGSSSRRGPQALLELVTWAERGYNIAITPDGPRGPRYVLQPGIMSLAQVTQRPIIPVSIHLGWKIQLRSWDRFQIPLPFSRCDIVFRPPIRVAREANDDERAALRQALSVALGETAAN